jgi:hypothetical protein
VKDAEGVYGLLDGWWGLDPEGRQILAHGASRGGRRGMGWRTPNGFLKNKMNSNAKSPPPSMILISTAKIFDGIAAYKIKIKKQ